MPEYRHDPLELRDAVRETLVGAGLTEAVTFALVSPRLVERVPGGATTEPSTAEPDQRADGRPDRRHEPALEPALRSCARA